MCLCLCVCHDDCPDNLTHWGRMTHICFSELIIVGSSNGLPPGQRQTNAGILLIGPLWTHFSEILIEIYSFTKMQFEMSSGNWQPLCLSLNVLTIKVWCHTHTIFCRYIVCGSCVTNPWRHRWRHQIEKHVAHWSSPWHTQVSVWFQFEWSKEVENENVFWDFQNPCSEHESFNWTLDMKATLQIM